MWGQVVVALRDDDTTRRRRADADDDATNFDSVDGGSPTAFPEADPVLRRRPSIALQIDPKAFHFTALAVMAMALIAPGGET